MKNSKNKVVKNKGGVLLRTVQSIFSFYPRMFPLTVICIIFSGAVSALPPIFMQNVIAIIEENFALGDYSLCAKAIFSLVAILIVFYVLALLSSLLYNQLMAVITQG